ncbi:MAG: hypothetical protein AB7T31_18140 [Gemmatimonadales bacterium]
MRTSLACAAVVAVVSATPAAAQIMEMNGSWELNPSKSLGPSPAQETLVFQSTPGTQRYTMTSRNADGTPGLTEWAIAYDGQDHPTTTGNGTTASVRRLDDRSEFVVNKRNGQITSTYTRVLVDDDRTIMSIGRNADGNVQWVRVFEKTSR